MKRSLVLALLFWSSCAFAQGISNPCAFGTTAGTCAQGGVVTAAGPIGSATVAPIITYNAAGQLTTVTSSTITPAVGSVTGLGTNVATALGVAVGTSGNFAVQTTGAWTPTPSNLTVVGTPSYSGTYIKTGHQIHVELTVIATTTTASTANSTSFTGLPYAAAGADGAAYAACSGAISNVVVSYGQALIVTSTLYTPTWAATGNKIIIACDYQTAS